MRKGRGPDLRPEGSRVASSWPKAEAARVSQSRGKIHRPISQGGFYNDRASQWPNLLFIGEWGNVERFVYEG